MSAIIVRLRKQGSEPETLRFDKEEIYIGRLEQNDITLSMTNVSKKHAVVWVDGTTIYVSDAGSTNGTYVNKRRVTQPTSIGPTDEVYVGDFVFTVQFEQAPENMAHAQPMESGAPYAYNKSARPSMPPPPRTPTADEAGYRTLGANATQASPPVMRMEPHRQMQHTDSLSDIYIEDDNSQGDGMNDGASYREDAESIEFDARHLPQDTIGTNEPSSEIDKTMAPMGYKDVGRGGAYVASPADLKPAYEKPGYEVREPGGRPDYLPPQTGERASHNDRTNLGSASPLVKSRRSGPQPTLSPPSMTPTTERRRPTHGPLPTGTGNRLGLDLQPHTPREPLARDLSNHDNKGARTSILGNESKAKHGPPVDLFKFPEEIKSLPDRVKFTEQESKFAEFVASLEADGINAMQVSPLSEDLLAPYLNRLEIDEPVRQAFADELLRMGPIHNLLQDDSVTEIFVNRYDQIVVKRGSESSYAEVTFHSPDSLKLTARRLARKEDDDADHEPAPGTYVDIRFMETAIATVTIPAEPETDVLIVVQRKQMEDDSLDALVESQTLSKSMATFLTRAMASGLNVLIAGPMGCQKLRLLSSLSALLPTSIRLIYLSRGHSIKIPTTGINLQESNQAEFDITSMIDTAISLRPDRIFLEQIKGVEAYSWVTSVATAVEGCVTTISASSTQDALGNLLTLSMLANHVPSPYAIKEQIARSLDLVVVLNNVCGRTRVVSISEIDGVDIGSFRINDIFRFKMDDSFSGHYEATGYIPQSYESLRQSGVDVDISIFRE